MAEKKTTAKTAPAPAVETVENPVNKMIDGLVEKAQAALKEFLTLDQELIDHIVHEMALAGLDKHQELARMAVEETGRGVYEDKVIKNMFATEYIWHDIKKEKTVGVLDENEMEGYVEVAEPVGVIAGVTPTTNPTSTTLFKSLIDLHAVHGERLVRALGAHLKRLCRPQRAAQVFLRGVRNDSKVLGAHGCAADGRDAENFADALLRRVDVLIARRLRVHRALRLVDFKIPQGFQAAAHGLEQHALEGGAVEPLQRHFALIGQNDLFHILQNSLSLK